MLNNFIKTYADSSKSYKYTTMIRHKGTVIALAMDDQRRIHYSILDLGGGLTDGADAANAKSPLDVKAWPDAPTELVFPSEIAEAGFGVADQTRLPVFKKNSAISEAPVAVLPAVDNRDEAGKYDYFLSTTARLSADAPFQALSDGQYVYLFRQAMADPKSLASPDEKKTAFKAMVFVDAEGHLITSQDGTETGLGFLKVEENKPPAFVTSAAGAPLVNSTLLVDRFLLTSNKLTPKTEVRFQRSRSKTRPASRKDSLGAKDLDGNFFFEPTQELKFIGHLTGGRFTALLLPTQVAEVQRWQIFAQNSRTGMMDSFNVERSADGLFNTRGSQSYTCVDHPELFAKKEGTCVEPGLTDASQNCGKTLIPRIVTTGYAESAVKFTQAKTRVILPEGQGPLLGREFTLETWIKPIRRDGNDTEPLALISSHGLAAASRNQPKAAPSLWIERQTRLRFGFGDGTKWNEHTTRSILTPDEWNHIAVTFDGDAARFYVNGKLREKTETCQVYLGGNLQQLPEANGVQQPIQEAFKGKTLPPAGRERIKIFGALEHSFSGVMDEVRIWHRARSQRELRADLHQRLTGLEPGLGGYWRFDEGSGNQAFDQTGNCGPAEIKDFEWAVSDAPIGEHPGINRGSFRIPNRSFESCPAAALYYQQSESATGYDGRKKPLKQSGRVMLAVATSDGTPANRGKNLIATIDFAVSATGRLAQMPDNLNPQLISATKVAEPSLNEVLDSISDLQSQFRLLGEDLSRLEPLLTKLNNARSTPDSIVADIGDPQFSGLNPTLTELKTNGIALELPRLEAEFTNATMTVFGGKDFTGPELGTFRLDALTAPPGALTEQQLEQVKAGVIAGSIRLSPGVRVTIQTGLFGEIKNTLTASHPDMQRIYLLPPLLIPLKSLVISEAEGHASNRQNALAAKPVFDAAQAKLTQSRNGLESEITQKTDQKDAVKKQLDVKQTLVTSGASVTMPSVFTDQLGLTICGGLLNFAWTKSAPLLFDSATGSLAMYFQGTDDQFFVAYYDTRTERAKYELKTATGAKSLTCLARSTDAEMDKIVIEVSDTPGDAATCQIKLTGGGIEETWRNVPRNPAEFARVLNGQAGGHELIGHGKLEMTNNAFRLKITDRAASAGAIPAGATIQIGDAKVVLSQALPLAADGIPLSNEEASRIFPEKLPIFFIGYDYAVNAKTTKLPANLDNGSALLFAMAETSPAVLAVGNQRVTGGSTLSCKWTADAPGTTLSFDGVTCRAELSTPGDAANASKLKSFSATGDLTMETWVRPSRVKETARVLHHRSETSAYAIGLEQAELKSALGFGGRADFISIPANDNINFAKDQNFTVEAWIKADPQHLFKEEVFTDIIEKWSGPGAGSPIKIGYPFVIRYLNTPGSIFAARYDGSDSGFPQIISVRKLNDGLFHHVAFVKDGAELRLYIDGILDGKTPDTTTLRTQNTSPLFLGGRAGRSHLFKGELDEVRIWKRARKQEEVLADMHRRLGGNETDLVGYWRFDGGAATDYSRNKNNGLITGQPTLMVSPIPAYRVFAGVNEQVKLAREIVPAGNWTHLAASYDQAYGMEFTGSSGHLDCGNDKTLDINQDLTIEVALKLSDLNRDQLILQRGDFNNADAQQRIPYTLMVNADNRLVFAFENVEGGVISCVSSSALSTDFCKVAVTRSRQKEEVSGKVTAWHEIKLYINGEVNSKLYVNGTQSGAEGKLNKYETTQPATDNFRQPVEIGNSIDKLVIGKDVIAPSNSLKGDKPRGGDKAVIAFLNGTIGEIRIWNVSRDHFAAADGKTVTVDPKFIGKEINGNEKGLISWWRFQEGSGARAFDSKSQNHADIRGARWVNTPDPQGSALTLYINGERKDADAVTTHPLKSTPSQFTLGALRMAGDTFGEFFQGEMEETRIWQINRTDEQIQDGLFRSLTERKNRGTARELTVVEEQEDLIAYYTFDANPAALTTLGDASLRGNHLTITAAVAAGHPAPPPFYVLSTAPISADSPQVRSALMGTKNVFNGLIGGTPAVQEYADMQADSQGNLIGVFKRSYAFVRNGQWNLITGYKVGDLATEWIGQVQFAPELIGYIEGAPPVPGENLTGASVTTAVGFTGVSAVQLTRTETPKFTYAGSRNTGFDLSASFKIGLRLKETISANALVLIKSLLDYEDVYAFSSKFENSLGWLEDTTTSVGRTTTEATKLSLRGRAESADAVSDAELGQRFLPDNTGQALVRSETADVFALRLLRNDALISYQMRPNPDIPKDWNVISFPLNPRYIKQGTLDGKIGLNPDADYPNALSYSPNSSYFKPIEAYALKNRIDRAEAQLQAIFEQYDAGGIGRRQAATHFTEGDLATGRLLDKLPNLKKRNLVNTYVWTANGGLFAETHQTMDMWQEKIGGAYTFKGMTGLAFDTKINFGLPGLVASLELLFGGHLNLTVSKTQEVTTTFGLNVDINLQNDILSRNAKGGLLDARGNELSSPAAKPTRKPGKVDAYRFMSFYLEPESDNHEQFFSRVVDPIWLESDDPAAAALRGARQPGKKPPCWRVLHRVTYVSRVLPPLDNSAPPSLEKSLQTLDIDSNFELIKQLEPFVGDKLASPADFSAAVDDALARFLPELEPHAKEIKTYLINYFGLAEAMTQDGTTAPDDPFGQASLLERAPNQPPVVNAGNDLTEDLALRLNGDAVRLKLTEAVVIDDRLNRADSLFVTWEKVIGGDTVSFDDTHKLDAEANFTARGRYTLRLTASDGQLSASDEITVVVNEPPVIVISPPGEPRKMPDGTWELDLAADVFTGLGDPSGARRFPNPQLTLVSGNAANVTIPEPVITIPEKTSGQLRIIFPKLKFARSGSYPLSLRAGDGDFRRETEVVIAVAARVTGGLQALYTFEESGGATVNDVSGAGTPLNLALANAAAANRIAGGLVLQSPGILRTNSPATRLADAFKSSSEITVEAWIKPAAVTDSGLARIVTLSNGPAARNFTLGQSGGSYHFGLRTTTTNLNAGNKALAAGPVKNGLDHVVCTRDKTGLTRFYLNGQETGSRMVEGDFSNWDSGFALALGNEVDANDGHDRAWLGEFRLVALYNRALSGEEVGQNFAFTADANLPPVISAGQDQAINPRSFGDAPVSLQLTGVITHDRPTPAMKIGWKQVGGPNSPEAVTFNPPTSAATTATFKAPAQAGRYLFRLTADDNELTASDEIVVVIQPATIGVNLALTAGSVTSELGAALKDVPSLKAEGLTCRWEKTGGPDSITLDNADSLNAQVTLSQIGLYHLTLTAMKNGRLWESIPVAITVNRKPVVTTGADRIINLPRNRQLLAGTVDKGLGNPQDNNRFTILWEKVSGAGEVVFDDPATPNTTATFLAGGVYKLKLTARNPSNESLSDSRELTVTVNQLPVVEVTAVPDPATPILSPKRQPDGVRVEEKSVTLSATVSDDGLPASPGLVTLLWEEANRLDGVRFSSTTADFTTATFFKKGVYNLQVTASDGAPVGATPPETNRKTVVFTVHTVPTFSVRTTTNPPFKLGGTQISRLPINVTLSADLEDNGLGTSPQGGKEGITFLWARTAGSQTATMDDLTKPQPIVTFKEPGIYKFEVEVGNGFFSDKREIQITVT